METSLNRAFTGSEMEAILLQRILKQKGINCLTRNGFGTLERPGFYSGTPSLLDVYVMDSDVAKAGPAILDYLQSLDEE